MFFYRFWHPAYRNDVTVDSGADTAAAALASIRRFIARENGRLHRVSPTLRIVLPRLDNLRREMADGTAAPVACLPMDLALEYAAADADRKARFPVGSRVRLVVAEADDVKLGTLGTVAEHGGVMGDDGAGLFVDFDGTDARHEVATCWIEPAETVATFDAYGSRVEARFVQACGWQWRFEGTGDQWEGWYASLAACQAASTDIHDGAGPPISER